MKMNEIKLIDSHFHLNNYKNHKSLYQWINENEQYTLCVTNNPNIYYACIKKYKETKYIRFGIGLHPKDEYCNHFDVVKFCQLAQNTRYIGEIGLDAKSKIDIQMQINNLEKIFMCTSNQRKIYSIHCRCAEHYLIEVLKNYCAERLIIHWYSGSIEKLNSLINLGCYFSVNANMLKTLKGKKNLNVIPKERIIVESDGPYTKLNNKIYSPEMLNDVYLQFAEFYKMNYSDFVKLVYENFKKILS
jgi:hypothetical protein cdifA_02383